MSCFPLDSVLRSCRYQHIKLFSLQRVKLQLELTQEPIESLKAPCPHLFISIVGYQLTSKHFGFHQLTSKHFGPHQLTCKVQMSLTSVTSRLFEHYQLTSKYFDAHKLTSKVNGGFNWFTGGHFGFHQLTSKHFGPHQLTSNAKMYLTSVTSRPLRLQLANQ